MELKRILVIGPIPPPFGGVSIHLQRLVQLMKDHFYFDFIDESRQVKDKYFNIRSKNLFRYISKIRNSDIIYINSGKRSLRIFHLFMGKLFLKKVVIIVHSFTATTSKLTRYVNGFIYRLADTVIVVSSDLRRRLFLSKSGCVVQEAFIPPIIEREPELPGSINKILLKAKKENHPIICANASRLELYKNQDLYGLDLCIEVTKRLLHKNIEVYFIFIVATTAVNRDIYLQNIELIKKANLQSNFFLITEKVSFVKLIERCDVVLRPTNTDGDSITVREALFLNKRVLASDVVERPVGVNLFKNRDIDDLEIQLKDILNQDKIISDSKHFTNEKKITVLKEKYLKIFGSFTADNFNEN